MAQVDGYFFRLYGQRFQLPWVLNAAITYPNAITPGGVSEYGSIPVIIPESVILFPNESIFIVGGFINFHFPQRYLHSTGID